MEELWINLLLASAAFVASFINVMAGAGSIVVITTMLFLDIPSIVAISTFRVALVTQSLLGARILHKKHKKIEFDWRIFVPIFLGSLLGTQISANIPKEIFDYALAGVIVFVGLFVILRHKNMLTHKEFPLWLQVIIFVAIGFYGGFVQVGTGFLLLAGLSMAKNLDLISANANKMVIIMLYNLVAVVVLAYHGKICWEYAPALVIGGLLGSYASCTLAIKKGEGFAKILLVVAIAMSIVKLVLEF